MKYCPKCGNRVKKQVIDGESRLVCLNSDCSYVHWNNPVPVVAALVEHDGKYILARNTKWPAGIYSFITGYLEYGEEVESAVLREVSEELGLEGEIVHYLGHYMFKEKNQLIMAFEVSAKGNLETNEELAEVKYVSKSELLAYDFHPLYITEKVVKKWSDLADL